jgi:hypothetical protein
VKEKGTVSKMDKKNVIETFSDYMNDETRVDPAEREQINFGGDKGTVHLSCLIRYDTFADGTAGQDR